jgi:hypothetical protein
MNASQAVVGAAREPGHSPRQLQHIGGPRGFTNLLVTKLPDGRIQFDPHATRVCTVTIEEDTARTVMNALARWLG